MSLAREQIPWKSKPYIHWILHFQSFVCSCLWERVIRENFPGSDREEEGEGEAGREGGNETGVLDKQQGAEVSPPGWEWSGRAKAGGLQERDMPVSSQEEGKGGFFSENWESFWRWCQKQSICLLRTLPTGREGMVQGANSLCKKERQGTFNSVGKATFEWQGKGTAGTEQGIVVPSARETSTFYIYMVFYTLQNAATITLKLTVICETGTIIAFFQMKKLSPRNKWYTWLQAF